MSSKQADGPRFLVGEDGIAEDLHVKTGKCPFDHGKKPEGEKPLSSLELKIKEAKAFLDDVHDVCPYAGKMSRENKIQWVGLPTGAELDPLPLRPELDCQLRAFFAARDTKRNMVFVYEKDIKTADDTHMAGKRLLTELEILGTKMMYPDAPLTEITLFVGQHRLPELLNPRMHVEQPTFRWRQPDTQQDIEGTIFVFMMSPLYHKDHPRYAPHTSVVLTYVSDVDRVFLEETPTAARIIVNAAVGVIAQGLPHMPVHELRRESSAEIFRDEQGRPENFVPHYHPAIDVRLQLLGAMFGGKKLFVYPPDPSLFR